MSRSASLLLIATLVMHLLCISAQDMLESSTRRSCLNRSKPAGYHVRNHVTVGTGNWTTSSVSAYIASILLDEVVGVQNTIAITNMIDVWDQIAAGDVHAFMEYWPSTVAAQEEQYIYQDNTVAYGGPVGIIGTAGWYMPRYVLKTVPTALSADFTNPEVAGYFNNTFILGDQYWGGVEQQVINDQGYNLTVKVLGGQEQLFDLLAEKYPKQEPLLFFLWRPHTLFSTYDLVRVSLPNNTIYYPSEILGKLMSPKLSVSSPEAQYLIQSYSINTNTMSNILTWVSQGNSPYDAACKWVTENEQMWSNWLRPTDYKEVSLDLQIAMWVLCGVCIAATFFYLIVTIIYRNSKVIIASSGVFLISMCIGGMLMFGAVVAFVTNTDLGCNLFAWFLAVGFALLFGSLFAKTGRVYLLFSNKSLQLVKYTDRDVGACVGVVLVGELVVLSVMTALQPAQYNFITEGSSQFSFCSFHEATGITLLAYNGVIVLFGIVISTLVARLRLTLYNEAKYIGWAMYNFALVVIFVVVIFLVTDVIVRFTVLCCCVLFITMVSLSVIFVPKIRLLFSYSEEDLRQMNEEQLQAVIRSYTKKFASSSDQKTSTRKGASSTNGAGSSYKSTGSTYEEEMTSFASTVKQLTSQIDELKKENKRLKETSTDQYQKMYETIYHENMIMKNKIFELEGRLKAAEQQKPSL